MNPTITNLVDENNMLSFEFKMKEESVVSKYLQLYPILRR